MRGISQTFERGVEEKSDPHQHDCQNLDSDGRAEQSLRKSLHLIFGFNLHLRRSAACDKDDATRRFFRLGVDAGDEVFRVSHDYCPSFATAEPATLARNVAGSLECA